MSNYEDINKKSKEANLAALKAFHLPSVEESVEEFNPSKANGTSVEEEEEKTYRVSTEKKLRKPRVKNGIVFNGTTPHQSPYRTRRRSKNPELYSEDDSSHDSLVMDELPKPEQTVSSTFRENMFGEIPGVQIGDTFETRLLCSRAGIHRPTVAGIHGGRDGCYSVALSGNYEDDEDNFWTFTYTGSGGRDLKGTKSNPKNLRTAPQSKDQDLNRYNLSLVLSYEKQLPVRVVRGYKLNSKFAPLEGYRYDGLYTVSKYYQDVGKSGFKVYKFVMERCPGQDLPWLE